MINLLLQVAKLLADHLDLFLEFFACLPDDIPLWVRVRVIGEKWNRPWKGAVHRKFKNWFMFISISSCFGSWSTFSKLYRLERFTITGSFVKCNQRQLWLFSISFELDMIIFCYFLWFLDNKELYEIFFKINK